MRTELVRKSVSGYQTIEWQIHRVWIANSRVDRIRVSPLQQPNLPHREPLVMG